MEEADLRVLEVEQNFEDIAKILRRFVDNNLQTFTFDELNKGGKKQSLFNVIFRSLESADASGCHLICLDCIRILSRDKYGLNEVIDERRMNVLLRLGALSTAEEVTIQGGPGIGNTDLVVAALKALCNLTYNSNVSACIIARSHAAEGILMRLRMYRDLNVPPLVKLFDMKLMFLITALSPEICPKLKEEYHAVIYLTESLDLVLKESKICPTNPHKVILEDCDVDICSDNLKVLFNLMTRRTGLAEEDSEDEALWLRLMSILHDLLLAEASPVKQEELRSNTVNLLTSVPVTYYSELMTLASPDLPKHLEFEGRNMEAIQVLIDFLSVRLAPAEKSKSKQELLSPLLTVLLQLSRKQRPVRKFLKSKILPPLKDVMHRPEEGHTLRAQLCRLLTSSSAIVKDLVADFLFILCKHNVSRMVKYTGYGNAAGLFASKGLLMGGRSHSSSSSYSSDSDSETEEYAKYVEQINPVVGCYEPPRPDPMAGMSDEQKEFETVQLVNLFDKLSRKGFIQPCTIDADGKPKPVEHVLELQEALPKNLGRTGAGDSSDNEE